MKLRCFLWGLAGAVMGAFFLGYVMLMVNPCP